MMLDFFTTFQLNLVLVKGARLTPSKAEARGVAM